MASERMRINNIASLTNDNGTIVEDHAGKEALIFNTFRQRLGSTSHHEMKFDLDRIIKKVDGLEELTVPFTTDEIDNVIKLMPADRAPGPNGFNGARPRRAYRVAHDGPSPSITARSHHDGLPPLRRAVSVLLLTPRCPEPYEPVVSTAPPLSPSPRAHHDPVAPTSAPSRARPRPDRARVPELALQAAFAGLATPLCRPRSRAAPLVVVCSRARPPPRPSAPALSSGGPRVALLAAHRNAAAAVHHGLAPLSLLASQRRRPQPPATTCSTPPPGSVPASGRAPPFLRARARAPPCRTAATRSRPSAHAPVHPLLPLARRSSPRPPLHRPRPARPAPAMALPWPPPPCSGTLLGPPAPGRAPARTASCARTR
nr:vegetative cell wall protein gp1-like [Aegilops tauschii subsp. strangulata]